MFHPDGATSAMRGGESGGQNSGLVERRDDDAERGRRRTLDPV
jgi:hypothetical protein